VGTPFLHVDHGCAVETHCAACLWLHGAATVSPVAVTLAPAALTPADPVGAAVAFYPRPAPRSITSRGPPQTA
jgi:hypothetical protein